MWNEEKWGHGAEALSRGLAKWRRGRLKASLFFFNKHILNTVYSRFVESLFIADFFVFAEIAVNQLDRLSPEEQLLVKCAAVIGHSFHTDLLQHLLPSWGKNKPCQVLRALVDIHVPCWFNKSQELPAEPILAPSSIEIIEQSKGKKKESGEEKLLPCSQAWTESPEWGYLCSERAPISCMKGLSLLSYG